MNPGRRRLEVTAAIRLSANCATKKDTLGVGALLLEARGGRLSHKDTMKSLELMGREVIPALKD